MKHITLLVLTLVIASPVYAYNVARTNSPSSDEPTSRNFYKNTPQKSSDYKSDDKEDKVRSGQSATERNSLNLNARKRCQNINGEWLRPTDAGYEACMNDSRTLKK